MVVSVDAIKELRRMTSASVADCKKVLQEAKGDMDKALGLLRKRGLEIAAKKQERAAKQGRIEAYVHLGNKIGVLLEVDCETDFVAKNSEFCQFTKDVAMQIAACDPAYIQEKEVPASELEHAKDKKEFYKAHCLMDQMYIKDPSITVKDYLTSMIAKTGENIVIRRFARYKIGE